MATQFLDFNEVLKNYSSQGLRMLAFPCNQFMRLEPASTSYEIMNGLLYVRPGNGYVPHPNMTIYAKIEVNGPTAHPLYQFLKNACPPTTGNIGDKTLLWYDYMQAKDIWWNFEKFLIDRQGRPIFRFNPTAWDEGHYITEQLTQLLNEDALTTSNP